MAILNKESGLSVRTKMNRAVDRFFDIRNYDGFSGDGVGNDAAAFSAAVAAAQAASGAVYLPPGSMRINTQLFFDIASELRIISHGRTTIRLDQSVDFRTLPKTTTSLTSDASRGDNRISVASVSDVAIGDIVHLLSTESVETGWNYKKQCVRRVVQVSESIAYIDQPLDFSFSTAETSSVRFYPSAKLYFSRVTFDCGALKAVNLRRISAHFFSVSFFGPNPGWEEPFSDGLNLDACDDVVIEAPEFRKLRYGPNITTGTRNVTIRDFVANQIRHMDANTWAQDILFENGRGINTDGIIQCHPCIRPTWRNVHDAVYQDGLYGLDLRGLGETVEHCSATSATVTTTNHNTNSPLLKSEYLEMAKEYTRTIRNFHSNTAVIKGGKEGRLIIEQCRVPWIAPSTGNSNPTQQVIIDAATTVIEAHDPARATAFENTKAPVSPAVIAPEDTYFTSGSILDITGITRASPAVVTSAGHGLSNGSVIYIAGVSGMTQVNRRFYKVGSAAANTFALLDPEDDSNIDASAWSAYTSGGKASPQSLIKTIDALQSPQSGIADVLRVRSVIFSETAHSSTSISVPVKWRAFAGGQVSTKHRAGRMKVRAVSRNGFAEAIYNYAYAAANFTPGISPKTSVGADLNISVSVSGFAAHYSDQVIAEGEASLTPSIDPAVNRRHYMTFTVQVTLPSASYYVSKLEIEIEEWRQ